MRLVELRVPDDVSGSATTTLDDAGVEYTVIDRGSAPGTMLLRFPVPAGAVDSVLQLLYDAGVPEDTYLTVAEIERAQVADQGVSEYVDGPLGDLGISHPEIRKRAEDLQPNRPTYIALAFLSALVAAAGLLLDSAIVVVGAMVISPFAGSSLSASVGAVIDDWDMVVHSTVSQLLGLAIGFVGAASVAAVLRWTQFVPEKLVVTQLGVLSSFVTPNVLTLAIAVCAGAAGALALATDLPVSIAGVAVAAALVPSAATAGIGTVWGDWVVVVGAVVLLAMNIVFINLTAYLTLVALGYRSSALQTIRDDLRPSVRAGAYGLAILAFAVVVVVTGFATYEQVRFERTVNDGVNDVLAQGEYSAVELDSVAAEYHGLDTTAGTDTVTVVVSHPDGEFYPDLANDLEERLGEVVGQDVAVRVRFETYQQPDDDQSASVALENPSSVSPHSTTKGLPHHLASVRA
ncbi:DUF389 domain-containing protein [Haloarchaeobius sp. DFWS5]|uniref:DUF389 domain-containing protein n=1 Tax=Haloarchaeobius sp. DFWS5 TaxID=3446114 RepID=UPI003EC120C5